MGIQTVPPTRVLLLGVIVAVWCFSMSATTPRHPPRERAPFPTSTRSLVIITVDGVRWQDVFATSDKALTPEADRARVTPHLHEMMTRTGAVVGAPAADSEFRVAGPSYLSLPGYMQLFTGRRQVACEDNTCSRTQHPTLADAVGRRFGRRNAVIVSSWPNLERAACAAPHRAIVSAGRFGGSGRELLPQGAVQRSVRAGENASAQPGVAGYRPDRFTAKLGFEVLRHMRPAFLFVGLGDTDEHAHHGNAEAYLRALRRADEWIGRFVKLAEQMKGQGHSVTLFVTTDHGRSPSFTHHADHPASARTWLVAWGSSISARGALRGADGELSDLAPTVAHLLGLRLENATGDVLTRLL